MGINNFDPYPVGTDFTRCVQKKTYISPSAPFICISLISPRANAHASLMRGLRWLTMKSCFDAGSITGRFGLALTELPNRLSFPQNAYFHLPN